MINEQLKTNILLALYEAWLSGPSAVLTLPEIAHMLGQETKIVACQCRFLTDECSAEYCHRSDDLDRTDAYHISANGIYEAEEILKVRSKSDMERVRNNNSIRKTMLISIQELRNEFLSPHGARQEMNPEFQRAYYQKIADKHLDKQAANKALSYLLEFSYVNYASKVIGTEFFYEVSAQGYEWLRKYEADEKKAAEHSARIASFKALKSGLTLTPQARGHELEKLLKSILEGEGWHCELNVRTLSQENDLIIHQAREYIIIECKWEQERKASPEYVSRLRDKVMDRPGFRTGILISMSGFTRAVASSVRQRLSDCMIILFGGQDIEDIMYGKRTFTAILDERFHAAMSRTEIIVGGNDGSARPISRTKKAPKPKKPLVA